MGACFRGDNTSFTDESYTKMLHCTIRLYSYAHTRRGFTKSTLRGDEKSVADSRARASS